jgi:serine/threonine protein kinase
MGGNFYSWMNNNYECFNWKIKIQILYSIARGLKDVHEKQMVHRDFHTGNILFDDPSVNMCMNRVFISDMGLCGEIGNVNEEKIYGVVPYVAPEVLRGNPYSQAADIYSFGMIMYFVASERQPFYNRAHDEALSVDICEGSRPEISELKAPKCYIELMEKCWDDDPENRPNIFQLIGSLSSISIDKSEIEKAETYRILHLYSSKGNRQITTQAIYISRLLNSECLECAI